MKTIMFCATINALLMFLAASGFSAPKDADLIIYFDYEDFQGDTVKDASGRGHDGVINGTITQVDDPDRGSKVAEFAAASFLDLDGPNIPRDDIPVDGMSILAWINVAAVSDMAIFNARAGDQTWLVHPEARGDGNYRWLLRSAGGITIFDLRAGKNSPNEWVHYAGTFSKDERKGVLYINGAPVGEADAQVGTGIAPDWDSGARVGYNIDNARPFTGLMDELNIWKRGLSQEEVQGIMNEGIDAFLAVEAQGKLTTQWGRLKGLD